MSSVKNLHKLATIAVAKEFNLANLHSFPFIKKVSITFPLGSSTGSISDKKFIEQCFYDMEKLTGSKPIIKYAKKSDAGLKIREGQPVSIMCSLRRDKMFYFLDKVVYVALPRLRDFRGLKRSFDKFGNFIFTIPRDSSVFYESNFQCDMSVCLSIQNSLSSNVSESLLKKILFPFI